MVGYVFSNTILKCCEMLYRNGSDSILSIGFNHSLRFPSISNDGSNILDLTVTLPVCHISVLSVGGITQISLHFSLKHGPCNCSRLNVSMYTPCLSIFSSSHVLLHVDLNKFQYCIIYLVFHEFLLHSSHIILRYQVVWLLFQS